MTKPRKELISVSNTPYYHIVSRCVRRTFLCGYDKTSNRNFDHRKQWIVDRIYLLSQLFSIDLCSYAVMSNHYHLVVHIDEDKALTWSDEEIAKRWTSLFKGPLLIQQWLSSAILTSEQMTTINTTVDVWRKRLSNLSWFMKCLNEPIARQANKEDNCTGHFWESRFKSQALTNDQALLSSMAYVDLNPVRASLAETPEESDYTSIQQRITPSFDLKKAISNAINTQRLENDHFLKHNQASPLLMPFYEKGNTENKQLPFSITDYIELVDWTGRIVREDKRGHIPETAQPVLQRLNINADSWLEISTEFEKRYQRKFNSRRKRKKAS